MLDLVKLSDELKYGVLNKETADNVTLTTPIFRVSFPCLIEPQQYQGQGPERFGLSMIWNIKDPSTPAQVDLTKVMLPAIAKFAAGKGLGLAKANPIKVGVRLNSAGDPVDGYPETCAYASAYKYPKNSRSVVPCYSPTGQKDLDPDALVAGYYARAILQAYKPRRWNTISLGLVSVQLIAEGEEFGGGEMDINPGGVEGAEEVQGDFGNSATVDTGDGPDFSQFQ
jgi:hypothetical protein